METCEISARRSLASQAQEPAAARATHYKRPADKGRSPPGRATSKHALELLSYGVVVLQYAMYVWPAGAPGLQPPSAICIAEEWRPGMDVIASGPIS